MVLTLEQLIKNSLLLVVPYVLAWVITTGLTRKEAEDYRTNLLKESVIGIGLHILSMIGLIISLFIISYILSLPVKLFCKEGICISYYGIIASIIVYPTLPIIMLVAYKKLVGHLKREGETRWDYAFAFNLVAILAVIFAFVTNL